MIVIYHDIGGAHSSVVAASIHLNRLSPDAVPDKNTLINIPRFDRMHWKEWGHLIYMGDDEFGARVYIVSRQRHPGLVVPAMTDMYSVLNGGKTEGLYLINTSPTVNGLMGIGGYSSRMMGLEKFGRPIVTYGTQKAYPKIADLVMKTKEKIRKDLN